MSPHKPKPPKPPVKPPKPPHRPKPPKPPHSGWSPPYDGGDKVLGTVAHSIDVAIAAIRALRTRGERARSCGYLISQLVREGHVGNISEILDVYQAEVNRYDIIPD
jgi:hypothetical protein